jgi:putative transposase
VDSSPEFIANALDRWAYESGITLDFSRPGQPMDNTYVEFVKDRFSAVCLDIHCILLLSDAREKISTWLREYNQKRAHTSLGFKSPVEFARIQCILAAS